MIGIAIAFLFGLATTVYLSLRSPEVKVPDVVGKNRFDAEKILADADLNFRVRATRPSNQAKPDTVLFQLPRPGEVVKTGQTVAMDISRVAKEGETPETVQPEESNDNSNSNANSATNLNENKPKKPKNKNANDNLNGNLNSNANTNANVNRPANVNRTPNANRPNVNATADNSNTIPRTNINRENSNTRTNSNLNENRRPVTPKPSPSGVKPN